jgi:endonuclease G
VPGANGLIVREIYIRSNDGTRKFATWVAYQIIRNTIGRSKPRTWKPDPLLNPDETLEPTNYKCAHGTIQTGRGHQVPLASSTGTLHWWGTNYLSNITPQKSA